LFGGVLQGGDFGLLSHRREFGCICNGQIGYARQKRGIGSGGRISLAAWN
jgi:hypothetical protein